MINYRPTLHVNMTAREGVAIRARLVLSLKQTRYGRSAVWNPVMSLRKVCYDGVGVSTRKSFLEVTSKSK